MKLMADAIKKRPGESRFHRNWPSFIRYRGEGEDGKTFWRAIQMTIEQAIKSLGLDKRCPEDSLEQALSKISSQATTRCWRSLAHRIRSCLKTLKPSAALARLDDLAL